MDNCKKCQGILSLECRCKLKFCIKHLSDHNCTYDYKGQNKRKLEEENPLVIAEKLRRI